MVPMIKKATFLNLLLCCISLVGCASDELRAPNLDDNKLYSLCSEGLFEIYTTVTAQKENIPPKLKQRLVSLLIAAEIDSQFKSYPSCVDKLERARLFINQTKIKDIASNPLHS